MSPWLRGQSGNPGGQHRGVRALREMIDAWERFAATATFDIAQLTEAECEALPLTASFVAAYLGITRQRVHQLDADLQPTRCGCGVRIYNQATVVVYAKKREGDRAALSRARSARMRELRKRL
jgi:hypothetical protein